MLDEIKYNWRCFKLTPFNIVYYVTSWLLYKLVGWIILIPLILVWNGVSQFRFEIWNPIVDIKENRWKKLNNFSQVKGHFLFGNLRQDPRWFQSKSIQAVQHIYNLIKDIEGKDEKQTVIRKIDNKEVSVLKVNKKYSDDVFLVWLFRQPHVCINDPKELEHIFQNYKGVTSIKKQQLLNRTWFFTGRSILFESGKIWEKQRKLMHPFFKFGSVKKQEHHVVTKGNLLIKKMFEGIKYGDKVKNNPEKYPFYKFNQVGDNDVKDNDVKEEAYLEMHHFMSNYTVDIIGLIAFDFDCECVDDILEGDKKYTIAVQNLLDEVVERFRRLFPDFKYAWKKDHELLTKVFVKILNTLTKLKPEDRGNSLLAHFLNKRDGKKWLDDKLIMDNLFALFIAGSDTTSYLVETTLYHVSQNPKVEEKLLKEIDTLFSENDPTFESISNAKYLDAVIKEALRIDPPIKIVSRSVYPGENVTLSDGRVIPGNAEIYLPIGLLGITPKHWKEDPTIFLPERWLSDEKPYYHPYASSPFAHGARNCIGMMLAQYESRIITALLFKHFKFKALPGHNPEPISRVTSRWKNGLYMKPIPRN